MLVSIFSMSIPQSAPPVTPVLLCPSTLSKTASKINDTHTSERAGTLGGWRPSLTPLSLLFILLILLILLLLPLLSLSLFFFFLFFLWQQGVHCGRMGALKKLRINTIESLYSDRAAVYPAFGGRMCG
jgi:hypothetical protein